jgi:hypothetical protein|tara:strand:+ start:645 stop:869 length:225 start_codon:yes stop_codon:yes gene_type:complete
MYFVITIYLLVAGTDEAVLKEYTAKSFRDTWQCHSFVHRNKMELLTPHIIKYGDQLKSWEIFCESRYLKDLKEA